ncbi:hypothetical protein ACUODJ_48770, partial [Escherichia sp. HC-CC]
TCRFCIFSRVFTTRRFQIQCFNQHAILAGLAFPICILLGMRDGTSFSHGLIDFIVLSGNSSKLWLFPIVGIGYAIVYYTIFRVLIKALDLKTPGREDATEDAKATGT